MALFLLEIGTEELPSRFLAREVEELARLFGLALDEAALSYGAIKTMATPRRLAIFVEDLAPVQETREETLMGPAAKIAYAPDGSPTKALQGFLRGNNLNLNDITKITTPKGEYVAGRRKTGGRGAAELLAEICPKVINELPFAKKMRWGANSQTYARPVRWLLALLDNEIVPFEFAGIHSDRQTLGHRVLGPGPFNIPAAADYRAILAEEGGITLDPAIRREVIVSGGTALAREKNGAVIWKDSLLDEVCGLVEHPLPLLGAFDPAYLEVPEEVLLTSMESHQKSFGLRGADGKLLPYFLTVLNITPADMEISRRGWERVLRARLEDARFFWRSDLASNFDAWLMKLDNVIFIGALGNMGDKSKRLEQLCRWLANRIIPLEAELAARTGLLAKADLVSGMVGEFDSLQGVMGGIYAAQWGEKSEVAQALGEQYLPAGPDTPLPESMLGALLSVADKADTLAGCFGLGMSPSGVADPNGLRRCALGIIRIFLDRRLDLPVGELFAHALQLYGKKDWKIAPDEALAKLVEFFGGRLKNYFLSLGYETVFVDAAMAAGFERVPDCLDRLNALVAFSKTDSFASAAQTLKRAENIVKKSGSHSGNSWSNDLLLESAEKDFAAALETTLPALDLELERGDYQGALARLESLRVPVDNFFNNVMVMSDDQGLARNRLALLKALSGRYARIAQFSLLQL